MSDQPSTLKKIVIIPEIFGIDLIEDVNSQTITESRLTPYLLNSTPVSTSQPANAVSPPTQ